MAAVLMVRTKSNLVASARHALRMRQPAFAALVFVGARTIQRWESGASAPSSDALRMIAAAVKGIDPTLAAELVAHAPPEAARTAISRRILVDSVVCAAAEAAGLVPSVVRPALFYAFARARDAKLSMDDVLAELSSKG